MLDCKIINFANVVKYACSGLSALKFETEDGRCNISFAVLIDQCTYSQKLGYMYLMKVDVSHNP